jgi:glyoxylase-like metal-dependent hydrolase (beta-lactamase superfamily II)
MRIATITAALIAVGPMRGPAPAARLRPEQPEPRYEVYAVRFATLPQFSVRSLIADADRARRMDIAMMFWLLKGPGGRNVIVDAGFYREKFMQQWKPADYVRPPEALAALGLSADSITDVIVSHVHWDHMDGVDLFPKAHIWIQRDEYEHYVREDGRAADSGVDSLDAAMIASLKAAGRVTLVDGDAKEILPGITVYTGGRHTFASQYAGVRTARGTVVVASDNAYLYENLTQHLAIAQTFDAASNLAAQERMKHIASAERLIIPGHDPAVFDRFPKVGPRVVRIE